jgi:inner membrane protein
MAARIGLLLAGCYLLIGMVQHERAAVVAREEALQRGHQLERLIVKPTMANLLLWRTVYRYEGKFYVDAVRVSLLGGSRVYTGSIVESFILERDLPQLSPDSVLYRDIMRFKYFSDDYLTWNPDLPNVLGDVRYSLLPTSTKPLWGIELNLATPDEHTPYSFYRDISKKERQAFISMLFNKELSPE